MKISFYYFTKLTLDNVNPRYFWFYFALRDHEFTGNTVAF